MATATLLTAGGEGWQASGSTFTTASISPAANSLLVFFVGVMQDVNAPQAGVPGTVSGGGLTWTDRISQPATASWQVQSVLKTAVCGATPGTFTLQFTDSGADPMGERCWAVYQITGFDTGTPVTGVVGALGIGAGNGGTAGAATGAETLTLTAAPVAADITLAFSFADANSASGGTFQSGQGWTREVNGSGASLDTCHGQRTGSTSTSVQWSEVNAGGGDYSWTGIAINVKATAGGEEKTTTGSTSLALAASGATGNGKSTVGAANLSLTASGTAVKSGAAASTSPLVLAAWAYGPTPPMAYPATRSGRKWLDQNGDVYTLNCHPLWAMPQNGSDADIATILAEVADANFNAVKVMLFGYRVNGDFVPFQNDAGDPVFTGTAYQSSLGSAWDTMDAILDAATVNGLTVVMSLYSCFGSTGPAAEIISAHTANSNNLYDFGVAVATRYDSYPNIVWDCSTDDNVTWGSTLTAAFDKFVQGVTDTETTPRLWLAENNIGTTSYEQWPSAFTGSGGFAYLRLDANSVYETGASVVEQFDAVWNEAGATSWPVWDCEPAYIGGPGAGAANRQQVRERVYATMIRGAVGINMGHEDTWGFGAASPFGTDGETLFSAWSSAAMLDLARAWPFLDSFVRDTTWTPTNSFVTTGTGTGDTKAAAGASDTQALAYFPNSRTIQIDTTILAGTTNVRLRWYDPTNDSYTLITASEAQQAARSVTHPGANSAGDNDWLLVVDLLPTVVGAASLALGSSAAAVKAGAATDATGLTLTAAGAAVKAGGTAGTGELSLAATGAPGKNVATAGAASFSMVASATVVKGGAAADTATITLSAGATPTSKTASTAATTGLTLAASGLTGASENKSTTGATSLSLTAAGVTARTVSAVGTASVALAAAGVASKTSATVGSGTLALAGVAAPTSKAATSVGAATLALTADGLVGAQDNKTATGATSVSLSAAATVTKNTTVTAATAVALLASANTVKAGAASSTSGLVLNAASVAAKSVAAVGSASFALAANGLAGAIETKSVTGAAALAFNASGAVVKVGAPYGTAALTFNTSGAVVKAGQAVGTIPLVIQTVGVPSKATAVAGISNLGLAGVGVSSKVGGVAGAVTLTFVSVGSVEVGDGSYAPDPSRTYIVGDDDRVLRVLAAKRTLVVPADRR